VVGDTYAESNHALSHPPSLTRPTRNISNFFQTCAAGLAGQGLTGTAGLLLPPVTFFKFTVSGVTRLLTNVQTLL
jgi:hypothetical protein